MTTVELRRVLHRSRVQNVDASARLVSLTILGETLPRSGADGLGTQAPSEASLSNYMLIEPEQLVVNPMWLTGGSIGVATITGAVSPAYRVYDVDASMEPRFLHHYVRCAAMRSQYAAAARGETTFDRAVSADSFESLSMPVFALDEQRRIADFLDDRVARIDQIIAARTAQLVLVHELEGNRLKLAVRGLTGSSPSTRLGRIARIHSGTSFPEDLDADGPYPVVGGNGEMGRGALANAGPGTVVVGRVGALCGNVHLLTEQAWVTDNALVVQGTTTSFDSPFVAATLHAYDLNSIAAKTAQPLVTGTQIADQRIPLVDTTQRQRVIELWENERRADERGLARLQAAIDLLQEYKQSLITAAVTGEFDVTTASTKIPE